MKRILVPTDFSPTAEKAFRFAFEIAERAKATIVLYHLFTPISSGVIYTETAKEIYNKQLESNLLKRLKRLKKKVSANNDKVPILTVVGRTPIINNILGFAEHNSIDFIVMGTQGASGLKKVLMGSVASRVIKKCDIPVLLVPEKFEWKIPHNIVFASDYLQADIKAIPVIYSFAKIFKRGIIIAHVYNASKTKVETEKIKNEFDNYSYSIQKTFSNYKLKFKLIESESINDTMKGFDNKLPHDVLAMVRGENKFYKKILGKSFTQSMAFISTKPLLIIPECINTNLTHIEESAEQSEGNIDFKVKKIKQSRLGGN